MPAHPRTHSKAPRTTGGLLVLASLLVVQAGCVTETRRVRPGLTRASDVFAQPPQPAAAPQPVATPAQPTPVAAPAASARTRDTRVRVALRPLGRIAYDGLTLPLVSPDGRFIASQVGPAPAWETLLAEPGGLVNPGTRLGVFSVAQTAVEPLSGPEGLPAGLLLGRSADERVFLVEQPTPDGTRRIGAVEWVSSRLTWLVDSGAFATLGPSGELVYSRRAGPGEAWELVIRPAASDPSREIVVESPRGESIVFPLASLDRSNVYALALDDRGRGSLSVVVVSLGGPGAKGPAGMIVAREALGVEPTLAAAFQATAPMQTPWPGGGGEVGLLGRGAAVVSARARSVVWVGRGGGVSGLAEDSAAVVPLVSPGVGGVGGVTGLLAATGRGVLFHEERPSDSGLNGLEGWEWGRAASVIASGAVPRGVVGGAILFDPPKQAGERGLGVLLLRPAGE